MCDPTGSHRRTDVVSYIISLYRSLNLEDIKTLYKLRKHRVSVL